MRARVFVRLRQGILDPQGVTIRHALVGLGFPEVQELRMGRILEISLDEVDAERARARLEEMCRRLLANPVTEEYRIEVEEGSRGSASESA